MINIPTKPPTETLKKKKLHLWPRAAQQATPRAVVMTTDAPRGRTPGESEGAEMGQEAEGRVATWGSGRTGEPRSCTWRMAVTRTPA